MENVYESYSETVYDRRYRIIERGCTTDYNPNLKQVKSYCMSHSIAVYTLVYNIPVLLRYIIYRILHSLG